MKLANIQVPADKIESFCRRWSVKELSLFGSILRDDFGPDSDVDVLVSLEPGQTMILNGFESSGALRIDSINSCCT